MSRVAYLEFSSGSYMEERRCAAQDDNENKGYAYVF